MGENSKIAWCHHTFNPWIGCSKIAPECENCYAKDMMDDRYGRAKWGPRGTRTRTADANWKKPLKWEKDAKLTVGAGPMFGVVERPRVFCASLADVFEDWDGPILDHKGRRLYSYIDHNASSMDGSIGTTMDDMRRDLFALIDATPNLDWLLLTKRPENIRDMWPPIIGVTLPIGNALTRSNVWLGCSAGTQATADKAIPELLKCRDLAPVLFVSAEPLLEAVDFAAIGDVPGELRNALDGTWRTSDRPGMPGFPGAVYESGSPHLDLIITGCESGSDRRPMKQEWAERIAADCAAAGVAYFNKQMEVNGKVTDDLDLFPEPLRIRQFPTPTLTH